MATQTEEISKTIALLKFETIRDSLKAAKCKSQGAKPQLVKNYESAVLDVGVEKFVSKLSADVVSATAKQLDAKATGSQTLQEALTEKIQAQGLPNVLGKADADSLKKFSTALGLEDDSGDLTRKIEDEVMLIGMEGFLQNLNPELLRKHCVELNLPKSGSKVDLVEKLMVHIFELEPLGNKEEKVAEKEKKESEKEKKDADKEKQKEEAKPKENKKRKAAEPKEKKATEKKAKVATESAAAPRPKRKASAKKVEEDEDVEEPPKRQKKEPKAPKEKAPKAKAPKEKTPRAPYVAPPLSTIVKGNYTAAELHNKFNLTDLQKYAKQEGLKTAGQKKVLIKRVIAYLETGKKEEAADKKTKPKKKAAPGKKKVAAAGGGGGGGGAKKKTTKAADKEKKDGASDKAEEASA